MLKRLLTAAFATTVLLIPASADAATYCVALATCPGGTTKLTINDALAASDASVEIDDIKLGYGKFPGHWGNAANRPVRIEGQGPSNTTLLPDDSTYPALSLAGAGSSVEYLGFSFPQGKQVQTGLRLLDHAMADTVGATAADTARYSTAFELGEGTTLSHAVASIPNLTGMVGVHVVGPGATVTDVTSQADRNLLVEADATIRRVRTDQGEYGVRVTGGQARFENVVVDTRFGTNGIEIDGGSAEFDSATVVMNRNKWQHGVLLTTGQLTMRDSIVTGAPINGAVTFDHVVRDPGAAVVGSDDAPIVGTPEFVMSGKHPFKLVPNSPLIDTGSDRPGDTDMADAPRLADGNGDCAARRDPGAYEAAATARCTAPPTPAEPTSAPAPSVTTPPAVTVPAATQKPTVSKIKVTRTKLTFTASAATRVKVTIKRGRRTVKTLTRQARPGANTIKLHLPEGRYRASVMLM